MTELPEQGDGGISGWISVLTAWMWFVVWTVVVKGLAVMLPTLQEQFETTTSLIGWVIATTGATMGLASPVAGLIGRRFGTGTTIMMSGFMVGVAVVVGSFSTSIIQLSVTLTFAGVGLGIPSVLTIAAVGQRFTTNYATAVGVSKSGSSMAMLLLVPLIQLFLDTYGWRGTTMLIGAISFHLAVCGALMVVVDKSSPHVHDYHVIRQQEDHPESETTRRCSSLWKYVTSNLDLKLLQSWHYWAAAAIFCFNYAVFDMWIIFFVSMAISKGFSPEDAALFVTVSGVGNLLSKVIQGFIIDRLIKSCWGPLCIMTCVASAMLFATPWLNSYWLLMTSSFIFMFCIGISTCLQDVLFKQMFGAELLPGVFGWCAMKLTIVRLCMEFIPGWFYDITGTYDEAFIFISAIQSLPLIPLLAIRYFKIVV